MQESTPAGTPPEEPRPLKRMFDGVPRRYDLLNRLLTLGCDEPWRRLAAGRLLEAAPARVLDLCCGTGDLLLRLAAMAPPAVELHGLDFSPAMLEMARSKAERRGLLPRLTLTEGNAAALPYPDAHFDAVGIAYAFRNLTWRNELKDPALCEVLRVLRPGGRFVTVETSQPPNPLWRGLTHLYLALAAGPLGTWISGHPTAYHYLSRSARGFYSAPEAAQMLRAAGFGDVEYRLLLGGVAALHVARKA